MTSNFHAHAELHAAFGFPDWCGHNWDAFNDCFGDSVEENNGALIAVIWRDIEVAARQAPATTAEVGWGLLDCKFGHTPTASALPRPKPDIAEMGVSPSTRHQTS